MMENFPGGSEVKASASNAGDRGSIPGSGRSPGEGNGNPLQYSCLENPMDGEAQQVTVHGVTKSRTRLSDFTFTSVFMRKAEGFYTGKLKRVTSSLERRRQRAQERGRLESCESSGSFLSILTNSHLFLKSRHQKLYCRTEKIPGDILQVKEPKSRGQIRDSGWQLFSPEKARFPQLSNITSLYNFR